MGSKRFYLLDFVRLISMVAIIAAHTYEMIYWDQTYPDELFHHIFLGGSKLIAFSGFTILFLSSFLYGKKSQYSTQLLGLIQLCAVGIVVLLVGQGTALFQDLIQEWDIYHLILVGLVSLYFIGRSQAGIQFFGAIGFIFLCIPFWQISFFTTLPLWLQYVFIGVIDDSGRGAWPILPWIGLIWFGYALGNLYKQKTEWFSHIKRNELWLWIPILIMAAPQLAAYYHPSENVYGPHFVELVYRNPPYQFLGLLVWFCFILRIAVLARLNLALSQFVLFRWISSLCWSRSFGLCYLVHLAIISAIEPRTEVLLASPWLFRVFVLSVMPLTEIIVRGLKKLFKNMVSLRNDEQSG